MLFIEKTGQKANGYCGGNVGGKRGRQGTWRRITCSVGRRARSFIGVGGSFELWAALGQCVLGFGKESVQERGEGRRKLMEWLKFRTRSGKR